MGAEFDYVANVLPFAPQLTVKATSKSWLSSPSRKSDSNTLSNVTTYTLPFPVVCTEWLDVYHEGVGVVNKYIGKDVGRSVYDTFNLDPNDNTKVIFNTAMSGDFEFVAQTKAYDPNVVVVDLSSYFVQLNEVDPDYTFTGATDVTLHILTAPAHGYIRVGVDRMSFQYSPKSGFLGVDSFSYKLSTRIGQESEPKCCYITVTP